jgi:outer membrane immunogenic protein
MKQIALATVLLATALQSSSIRAADLPTKAINPPASWTGFYSGLGVGIHATEVVARTISVTENGVPDLCPNGGQCFYSHSVNGTQFRFSFYGGFNWQLGSSFLIGIEGDGGWARKSNGITGTALPGGPFLASGFDTDRYSINTVWDASARLRGGYLVTPSFLMYATGGAAWLNFSSTLTCGPDPVGTCAFPVPAFTRTTSVTKIGWTVGGGIETKVLPHILMRGEYRFSDFGNVHFTENVNANGVFNIINYQVHPRTQTALLGLAYLFGSEIQIREP